MFEFFKNIKMLKELNETLSKESIVVEKEGVKVKINGKMEVEEIVLNPGLDIAKLQKILKDLLNDGLKKIQTLMISKFSEKKFFI
ncbi:MAG: YbaB/EbfC family nucleoid-associated protein [Endomicrobiia bacterium]